jgi:hypothetical protein
MPWQLKIGEGRQAHELVDLAAGASITFGRGPGAMQVFPDDSMSSLQFVVGLTAGSPRLQNLSKTSPTQVNGAVVETAVLHPGDKIQAGQTNFMVVGPEASPFPAQIRLGGWGFEFIPPGWDLVEGIGFQLSNDPSFRASVTAVEESLPEGQTLADYTQTQLDLIRSQIPGATTEDPADSQIRGAEQAVSFVVTAPAPGGAHAISRQTYALCRGVVGIVTATFLDRQKPLLHDILSRVEGGLSYFQG